jgi:hypothetical protein
MARQDNSTFFIYRVLKIFSLYREEPRKFRVPGVFSKDENSGCQKS